MLKIPFDRYISVNNNKHFTTTKGAVSFTGGLKRGNYDPFCSPKVLMLLTAILLILPSWNSVCLETPPNPLMQNGHLKPDPLLSFCDKTDKTRIVTPPFLFDFVTRYGYTKKYILGVPSGKCQRGEFVYLLWNVPIQIFFHNFRGLKWIPL